MYVLVADDEPLSRTLVSRHLRGWGYDLLVATEGEEAWQVINAADRPLLAILDWSMPGLDGPEICRRIRRLPPTRLVHAILLTARTTREDIIAGLNAGADDYLTKPFDPEELYARLQTGERLLRLQETLADRVRQVEEALARVKQLQGLLPICTYCKCIRNDQNYWMQVEHYISTHLELQFSHGICPSCYHAIVEPQIEAARQGAVRPSPVK